MATAAVISTALSVKQLPNSHNPLTMKNRIFATCIHRWKFTWMYSTVLLTNHCVIQMVLFGLMNVLVDWLQYDYIIYIIHVECLAKIKKNVRLLHRPSENQVIITLIIIDNVMVTIVVIADWIATWILCVCVCIRKKIKTFTPLKEEKRTKKVLTKILCFLFENAEKII